MSVKAERDRQAVKVRVLYDYLRAHEGEWISAKLLSGIADSLAVSTKISQARDLASVDGYEIPWNEQPRNSCYMLRPVSLGRDAAEPTRAPWDQDRPFAEPFKLTPP